MVIQSWYEIETREDFGCEAANGCEAKAGYRLKLPYHRKTDQMWLCQLHYSWLPVAEPEPAAAPLDVFQALAETKTKNYRPLAGLLREFIELPLASLQRKKGTWKWALTAKVVSFYRRSDLIEELEFAKGHKAILAVVYAKEIENGATDIQPK